MSQSPSNRPASFELRAALAYTGVAFAIVCAMYRSELAEMDPAKWASVSAWAALLVGACVASQLRQRFESMLRKLHDRKAISISENQFEQFITRLNDRAAIAARIGSVVLPSILLVAYATVEADVPWNFMSKAQRTWMLAEIALEAGGAWIVGRYVGRGIFYGLLGKQMTRDGVSLRMIFGHSDRAAGLRPIGDFYFYQAIVTALPVVFFAFWVLMMPVWNSVWPHADDSFALRWKNAYLLFFFIALAIESVAFVLPLWIFHRQMTEQKARLQPRADHLSAELAQLQRERALDGKIENGAIEPAQLIEQINLLETLPTWPLAPDVRNRFAWGNLALLASPALKISHTAADALVASLK